MTQCNHLSEGYAAHLVHLAAPGGSRPAQVEIDSLSLLTKEYSGRSLAPLSKPLIAHVASDQSQVLSQITSESCLCKGEW